MAHEWRNGAYKGARKQMTESESSVRFYAKMTSETFGSGYANEEQVKMILHWTMQLRTAKDKFDAAVKSVENRMHTVFMYADIYKSREFYTEKQIAAATAARAEVEAKKLEVSKFVDDSIADTARRIALHMR